MNTSLWSSFPASSRDVDVVVVGGGLAGLTAAAFLGRAGRRVELFERGAVLGGRARVQQRAGFHLNLGPHALYLGGAGAAILREVGVAYSGASPSRGGLLTRSDRPPQAIPGTLPGLLRYRGLSMRERLRAVGLFASIARGPFPSAGLSFDAWLAGRRASRDLAALFRAFLRLSTYIAASDQLSAEAGVRQLRQSLAGVIYVDGGWATLIEGVNQCARQSGVAIRSGCSVKEVCEEGTGLAVVLHDGSRVRARNVILAVSPRQARKLLGQGASAQLQRCAHQSRPVIAACLDIGLRRLPRPKVTLALDLDLPRYMACHSVTSGLAPPGCSLLQLAYYGEEGATARSSLKGWLDTLQPGWRDDVVMQRWLPSARVCEVLPSAEEGGLGGRLTVDAAGPAGVMLCGDWVGPVGLLSDASFASAREAATRVLHSRERERA